jgi:hypothetical protein
MRDLHDVSPAAVVQGAQLWASSFLPSAYQGTLIRDLQNPIANLRVPDGDIERQRDKLDALRRLNEIHKRNRVIDGQLDARIAAFELAFRMQRQAPEAFDINRESTKVKALYGIGDPVTDLFGRQCLLARRLVERGVRYVQLFDAPANNAWDHHSGLRENLPKRCAAVDRRHTEDPDYRRGRNADQSRRCRLQERRLLRPRARRVEPATRGCHRWGLVPPANESSKS